MQNSVTHIDSFI